MSELTRQSEEVYDLNQRIVAKERQLAEASEFVAVNKGLLAAAHLRIAIKDAALQPFADAYERFRWDSCRRAAEARKM